MLPSNTSEFELKSPQAKKDGGPRAGLFVTIILLALLIGVIAFAVTRLPTGTLSRPAQSSASAAPTAAAVANGVTADATTQQAIQDVIRKLDEAQAQAIATNDPNVMVPTATADFYQQQVAINQDLVNNGVTEVKLLNLEWGQISVAGNTASATVYETWSTTFDDGTTEQARDRNVYTLVQENGSWKVQADDHPDQQQAGAPGPAPAP
jgi:ketosteroid isomerase-like protein